MRASALHVIVRTRLNHICITRPAADSDLVCQPGTRWMDINDHLKEKGRYCVTALEDGKSDDS